MFEFSAQGVRVSIRAHTARFHSVLERLMRDFAAFPPSSGSSDIVLNLTESIPSAGAFPRRLGCWPNAEVFGAGPRRVCVYPGKVCAESVFRSGVRHLWVAGESPHVVHEVAYTAILSALGEELDARGFHRAHALGLEVEGHTLLLLGASGAGKSSIATLLLRDPAIRFFSDECPLLGGRTLYPFPLRLALVPEVAAKLGVQGGEPFKRYRFEAKHLIPAPRAQIAPARDLDFVLIAADTSAKPRIRKSSRLAALPALFGNLVIGLGQAQMAEWMLRADAVPRLVAIALRRLAALCRLLSGRIPIYKIDLSRDPYANAACLLDFIEHQRRKPPRMGPVLASLVGALERPLRHSAFRPLHELVRLILLNGFIPHLSRRLQRRMRDSRFHLIARNSLTRPGAYNIFRSDVDCSAIAPDTAALADLAEVRRIYESWRRRWLMLGELEIYMNAEHKLERELAERFGPLLERIRLLRKWHQIEKEDPGDTEYHREKLRLGRESTFRQLTGREYSEPAIPQIARALEEFLIEQFPAAADVAPPEGVWHSLFLGWDISAKETANALVLPRRVLVLLSILPDFNAAPAAWRRELYKFRVDAKIAASFVAVLTQEYLLCHAVSRDPSRDSEELRGWMRFLREEISIHDGAIGADIAAVIGKNYSQTVLSGTKAECESP